ncbi:hypothetical protein BDN72DRAFT_896086 [Pluteus cervinus]|uniref:Uncharacterized protein n=1 Tax=Pluteus cervinus TaxID=181527 RepID=A0ACD3AZC3_9AGAR|nr:hypothetical protein BDN72DRAFT_896086 [Pluteus cervinus]
MFVGVVTVLLFFSTASTVAQPDLLQTQLDTGSVRASNVSSCPGYRLQQLQQTSTGLHARLTLAGPECNLFGADIHDLSIDVTYETKTRLHVKISDTANKQYTIPKSVVSLPDPPKASFKQASDLVFNYQPTPFAFWITRRSHPWGAPLFDTRISSLPRTPIAAANGTIALDGFPLVFEDQYLQLTSALPLGANIYGLGEVVSSSGFRRDVDQTVQTMWARDIASPVDENIYGSHPIYLEHRFDQNSQTSSSHGVFLFNAAGSDILLLTPPKAKSSLIQYRLLGGILDFYFLSGPTPMNVVEQYGELVGFPTWQPIWGFGFHLCRWGYHDVHETKAQVENMRAANIPLEVMWNDIDMYHAVRDFTTDPVTFPESDMKAFMSELSANHQRYIPIVDAAVAKQVNSTDFYDPYTSGAEKKVFITNPDGSEYIGQVWPGYTVFPDWFVNNTQQWWTDALRNWSQVGVDFSGIWLDMNEASSFCDGSCGTSADLSNTSVPFILPGAPGNPVTDYPECYNAALFGPSGNITVNGTFTCQPATSSLSKRGMGAGKQSGVNLNTPPYAIHNGNGRLSEHALATNATHVDGEVELDVHNLWGLMEEKTTHLALLDILPGKRPFLISRSTFASAGKWTGHWLGDNFSLWSYLRYSIQGVLQFQLFQIPFVGADTCGFRLTDGNFHFYFWPTIDGNTDEELCNRWMQLAAFTPFYRNHNIKGAIPQEPYRWDSVANATRTAIAARYSLLPYWYSLFADSSTRGTPPVRALFFEFPNQPELFSVDRQFLIGRDILVTPVLEPNVTRVTGVFPGRGSVIWRDWYTHDVINPSKANGTLSLSAPLGHINVHIRDHSAILLHAQPAYTTTETRQGPFSLLVSLDAQARASGHAYLDDGESYPPGPSRTLAFQSEPGVVKITGNGSFHVDQKLAQITVLGLWAKPHGVSLNGKTVTGWQYLQAQQKLVVGNLAGDLNGALTLQYW